jgi:hypothetical protein
LRRLLLLAMLALAAPLVADDRTAETRRLLELLAGVRLAYLEASRIAAPSWNRSPSSRKPACASPRRGS